MGLKNLCLLLISTSLFSSEVYFYQNKKKVFITPTQLKLSNARVATHSFDTIKYFTTSNNILLGITNEILVKYRNMYALEKIQLRYSLVPIKRITHDIYLYKIDDADLTLKISNALYEEDDIEYAHPNFIKKTQNR
ncbi:hypothetical protein KJ877_03780 [bacterium]|nr:hypothetical protein [bacterium]MBU1991235.1 hypothetical protein [bacterium]